MTDEEIIDGSQTVDPVNFVGGNCQGFWSFSLLQLNDGFIGGEEYFVLLGGYLYFRGLAIGQEGLNGLIVGGVVDCDVGSGLSDQELLRQVEDGVGDGG